MNRFLAALLLFNIASADDPVDPFSAEAETIEASRLNRLEILKSRINSHRVITIEEIECLPEDITFADIIELFGMESAVAPEIPFFFAYPREGKPRASDQEKYRYGFYFWPIWKDVEPESASIYCISYLPEEPKGELLSAEWAASHKIIWPESKIGTTIQVAPVFDFFKEK